MGGQAGPPHLPGAAGGFFWEIVKEMAGKWVLGAPPPGGSQKAWVGGQAGPPPLGILKEACAKRSLGQGGFTTFLFEPSRLIQCIFNPLFFAPGGEGGIQGAFSEMAPGQEPPAEAVCQPQVPRDPPSV